MSRRKYDHFDSVFGGFPQDSSEDGFNKMFKGFLAAWAVWALFCLALVIGVIVVAIHFLSKVW